MRNLLLIACVALPLVACAGAVDQTDNGSTAEQKDDLSYVLPDGLADFDQVNGTPIANNSIVDTTYTGIHVTLSCIVCASGHAYARTITTGSQGVSLINPQTSSLPFFDARDGAVTATFNTPRTWVSIDAAPVLPPEWVTPPTNLPWLEAYDVNGNKLGEALYPINYGQPNYGTMQTLKIATAPFAQIKTVRFSSQHNSGTSVYGEFDNLRFNGDLVYVPPPPPPRLQPILP